MSHLAMRSHFIIAINATFDFLFDAENTKSRNELQWSACDSIAILARINIFFLCNAQAVHTIRGHMTHSHENKTKSRAR